MLIWVSALHCEAKPVIDHYRLKKSADHHAFDLYQNNDIVCIISGIGKIAVAAATAWAAALFCSRSNIAWINLGIAGSASDSVGGLFWINKITDQSDHHYFPVPTFKSSLEPRCCLTLNEPGNDYHADYLIDMEASAFFTTATRFSSAELVHCLKVISDNQDQPPSRDKAAISLLIQNCIKPITDFAEKLQALCEPFKQLDIEAATWKSIIEQAHFSQTQQVQLRSALRFLMARQRSASTLASFIHGLTKSRDILAKLDQLRLEESRNL